MWALHRATLDEAVVWVRHTANGLMTVQCNGQIHTGDTIDTTVDDGCGVCAVTGLEPGRTYPFSLYVGAELIVEDTLKTMPATGSKFTLGFGSCVSYVHDQLPLHGLLKYAPDLAGFVWVGDQIYANEPTSGASYTNNGETILQVESDAPLNEAATMAQLYKHYRLYWKFAGTQAMLHACPNWFIGDDHDHGPGNDWDWTIASANRYIAWASTQQHVDDMGDWCNNAFRAYCKGNPDLTNLYYKVTINDDCEAWFLDGIQYRDAADGTGTTCLGATQLAFLLDGLAASTATWKLIFCTKNLYGGADDFSKYATEREIIDADIASASGWLQPGGVVWLSGDIHYPYVSVTPGGLLDVCASPLGSGASSTVADGYVSKMVYKCTGNISAGVSDADIFQSAGFVTIDGSERLTVGLVDTNGSVRWSADLTPGSNAIRYGQTKFG